MIRELTDETFQHVIDNSTLPVLVVWRADWACPCRVLDPRLECVSNEFSEQLHLYKIDFDQNPQITTKMNVRGIPTTYLFKNGTVHSHKSGDLSIKALKEWLDTSL